MFRNKGICEGLVLMFRMCMTKSKKAINKGWPANLNHFSFFIVLPFPLDDLKGHEYWSSIKRDRLGNIFYSWLTTPPS